LTDAYLRTVNVSVRVDVSDTKVEGLQVRISPQGKGLSPCAPGLRRSRCNG